MADSNAHGRLTQLSERARGESVDDTAKKLVDEVLAPLIAADGGTIELVDLANRRLRVRLGGACKGCPGRPYTLTRIVEPLAKRWLGQDVLVEAVQD